MWNINSGVQEAALLIWRVVDVMLRPVQDFAGSSDDGEQDEDADRVRMWTRVESAAERHVCLPRLILLLS